MTCLVYRRPEVKPRVEITPELACQVLSLVIEHSQNNVARRLGISQSAVSKIVRRNCAAGLGRTGGRSND
jgi:predicted transcriptional regulator